MSVTKIGLNTTPDIETIKKNINHDALYYNIKEQQAKIIKKHLQRQKQLQQFQLINRRVSTQLNQENNKNKQKKTYIQQQLSHFYDQQIQQKKINQVQQVKKNRSYAQAAQENQKQYHEKRSRQLARIYRAQRTFQSINPQSQLIIAKKKTQIFQNLNAYHPDQFQTNKNNKMRFQTQTPQQFYQISPVNSRITLPYKDYLKQQIEKKKIKKQEQSRNRLQIQKQLVRTNQQALLKQKQELKIIQRKQKQAFRKGLQDQIAEKKNFKNLF